MTPDGYAYRKVRDDFVLDGRLISSKMVVSPAGDFIGSVVPGGSVSDFDSQLIGKIRASGFVYNERNQVIGRIVVAGYAFDDFGRYLGYVSYNGEVLNQEKIVGRERPDGRVINEKGEPVGFIVPLAATATDLQGRYLGAPAAGRQNCQR